MTGFARAVGQAVKQEALGFRSQDGGAILPPPNAAWTTHALQSRSGYYATLDGQQMAALYRQRRESETFNEKASRTSDSLEVKYSDDSRDLFISHASEDKEAVARPLSRALVARGWSVWLDELELTVGDSLSGHIDAALARSRFGIAIISPAWFAKEWPQRELAGLAAREVDAGTKVILPVWHEVDRSYVARRSPILADRLGALTGAGIDDVADKISLALERAGMRALTGLPPSPVVQSVEPDTSKTRLPIPSTPGEQERLIAEQPDWWEYRLYAGVLLEGKLALETKWDDHQLRMPRGPRQNIGEASALEFLSREIKWMHKQIALIGPIFDKGLQEQAFGQSPGEADPQRIQAFSRRLIKIYEAMLDWAAGLRATTVPEIFDETLDATACLVDTPVMRIRAFIDDVADQTSRLPELAEGGTRENPAKIKFELHLDLDPAIEQRYARAFEKLSEEMQQNGEA
jgi:TIR domain